MNELCLITNRCKDKKGYGRRTVQGKGIGVHEAVWIENYGPIPKGMCVCHECDNPPCEFIGHLTLGTKADNNAARTRRGRGRKREATRCKNGHPYDEQNTYIRKDGQRDCKECLKARRREWWRRYHPIVEIRP